jgi:hypothetical protein
LVGCGVTVGVEVGHTVGETVTVAVGCFVFVGIGLFVGEGMGVSGTAVASSVGAGEVRVRVGSMERKAEPAGETIHELAKKTSVPNNRGIILLPRVVKEQKQLTVCLKAFSLVLFMTRLLIRLSIALC